MIRPYSEDNGSALLATLLVTLTIVLVGTAFLMMAQIESRITRNEFHATRARYAAEAGARAVKGWFEHPGAAPGFPADPRVVIRDREMIDEADPYGTAPTPGGPQYKAGVDLDADGRDDLFEAPYRGARVHELLGTEDAPDLRIEDEDVLVQLSQTLFGDLAEASGVRVRIRRIDVFAPPYLRVGNGWVRHGTATIKVVAGIERADAVPGLLAERTVRIVLNRVPYAPSRLEAVHACGNADLLGEIGVRWGAVAVTGDVSLPGGPVVEPSLPRGLPGADGSDRLWTGDPAWVAAFNASLDPGETLADPWIRVVAGGAIDGAPSGDAQPWAGPPPPRPGAPGPWPCCDRSNLFQHQPVVCPDYGYEFWKRVARSGFNGAQYYAWHPANGFRENGIAPGRSFTDILAEAAAEPGLRFFDTVDGRRPRDADADGRYDNLTPPIRLEGTWAARGFLFVNAERLVVSGLIDTLAESFRAPGEPSVGAPDAWVDLVYPNDLDTPFQPAGPGAWDARGPEISATAAFRGVLVTSGALEARFGGTLYGAVVTRSLVLDGSIAPATRFFRDPTVNEAWPPPDWDLPRFVVSRYGSE
jgi:hypothetical protein